MPGLLQVGLDVRSGSFKDLVTIEHRPDKTARAGFPAGAWESFADVFGAFRWMRGSEAMERGLLVGTKIGEFSMPYFEGVTETMRLHRSEEGVDRYFKIIQVIDVGEARREMKLQIEELPKEHFVK